MIDERYALRWNAFVVELVVAEQIFFPKLFHGGVVHDAQKTGQDWLADFLRKGLAFGGVFLTVAFGTVAKDFVEKDGGSAAGQERWSNRRLVDRGFDEAF